MKNTFDIKQAIKDEGVCHNQTVVCKKCPIGVYLGYSEKTDQFCHHEEVLRLCLLIDHFKKEK